jgi:hypothetical protein
MASRQRTRRESRRSALWAFLALAGLTGCTGGRSEIAPVRDPVLRDIPKPQGFALVDERSTAFTTGRMRLAKCEYVGGRNRDVVRQFYETYMPQAAFELKQWNLEGGVLTMTFESEEELCTIRIRPQNWNKTVVGLELSPLPDTPIGEGGQPVLNVPPPRPPRRGEVD